MPTRHAEPIAESETQRPPIELMLRSLTAAHREILVATYFERRTTREAALSLGLTTTDAKARLYDAMRELTRMVAAGLPDRAGPDPSGPGHDRARRHGRSTGRHLAARARRHAKTIVW